MFAAAALLAACSAAPARRSATPLHHKTTLEACTTCRQYHPCADCRRGDCGDRSGEFCWSPGGRFGDACGAEEQAKGAGCPAWTPRGQAPADSGAGATTADTGFVGPVQDSFCHDGIFGGDRPWSPAWRGEWIEWSGDAPLAECLRRCARAPRCVAVTHSDAKVGDVPQCFAVAHCDDEYPNAPGFGTYNVWRVRGAAPPAAGRRVADPSGEPWVLAQRLGAVVDTAVVGRRVESAVMEVSPDTRRVTAEVVLSGGTAALTPAQRAAFRARMAAVFGVPPAGVTDLAFAAGAARAKFSVRLAAAAGTRAPTTVTQAPRLPPAGGGGAAGLTVPGARTVVVNDFGSGSAYTSDGWGEGWWRPCADSFGSHGPVDFHTDWAGGHGAVTAEVRPTLPSAGCWRVEEWHPSGPECSHYLPVDAELEVFHAHGTTRLTVDQSAGGGRWAPVGAFDFAAGSALALRFGNGGGGRHCPRGPCWLLFDAWRFVRTGDRCGAGAGAELPNAAAAGDARAADAGAAPAGEMDGVRVQHRGVARAVVAAGVGAVACLVVLAANGVRRRRRQNKEIGSPAGKEVPLVTGKEVPPGVAAAEVYDCTPEATSAVTTDASSDASSKRASLDSVRIDASDIDAAALAVREVEPPFAD